MAPPIVGLDGVGFDPAVLRELYQTSIKRLADEQTPRYQETNLFELYKTTAQQRNLEERLSLAPTTKPAQQATIYHLQPQTNAYNTSNNPPTPTLNQPSLYRAA